jgi:hypothetical protein
MKPINLKSPLWSLFVMVLLTGLPFLCSEAQARGGFGGYHGGGGFSGGSFRGAGGYAEGPRGGGVAEGPRGGEYARTARGGEAARGPYGGVAARGSEGGTYARVPEGSVYRGEGYVGRSHMVTAPGSWGPYYGPGHGGVAAGLAVGTVVGALPAAAAARTIAGQRYYYDGSAYYQPCYQGTDVNYCVVPDPNK